ncbi:2-phosphosulfolactate phosphatase [Streptomyces sp. Je 1-79]|uniref:2-phosphosulfolactate phosphatase n=1 Tax=Streptomyces sp. Je 1-79 TaxID=2943847 RepID=UPI0021A32D20|nr:2-phosphosulfolactate phosphatase [Streptomyces sp. Je 1-79]MCT4353264.1 2-phosphosulfolactate phosphatase [Streptomyces sp. Je 1-79]
MGVTFGWGPTEAAVLARDAACLVVVDVLSFTTSVGVAVESGTAVFPYRWRDETAAPYAAGLDAALAVGRGEASPRTPWTLSPAALRAAPPTPRLVLPSPNGSTISAAAADATVVAASLRNRTAVARWLARHGYGSESRPLTVIASGERWPDGSLRPALEDLLGAGAVLSALCALGPYALTPEARAAATLWEATDDPVAELHRCDSGRELYEYGYPQDVAVAAEADTSETVPVLRDGAFQETP